MLSTAKKVLLVPALALLAAGATPALADTIALYASDRPAFSMKIEIDDNGDVRGQIAGQPRHFIKRGGELFLIEPAPSGDLVIRIDDLRTAIAERSREAAREPRGGRPAADTAALGLVQKGDAIVNGRRGKAWFDRTRDGALYPQPVVVISDDPALAPLGEALAAQYAISAALIGDVLGLPAIDTGTRQILESGAPLQFADLRLQTVSRTSIGAERFNLPAPPLTLEQVREWLSQRRS